MALLPVIEHRWDLPPTEAIALQRHLASRLILTADPDPIKTIAGIDVSIRGGEARAAVIVLSWPDLREVEHSCCRLPVTYPYVPGLLTFREAPTVLQALAQLRSEPDLLMFDGQGYAHPRRFGLASHLGFILDRPSIGCAKSRLCGTFEMPAPERGSSSPLLDGGEMIGAVVRTRSGVRPLYVSAGYRVALDEAVSIVLAAGRGYRLPEPTRLAHKYSVQWVRDT